MQTGTLESFHQMLVEARVDLADSNAKAKALSRLEDRHEVGEFIETSTPEERRWIFNKLVESITKGLME